MLNGDNNRPAAASGSPKIKLGKAGILKKKRASHAKVNVVAKAPSAFSKAELTAFAKLARQSKEVETQGLPKRIKNAAVLLMLIKQGKLIGIAALKRPDSTYRTSVGQKSGVPLPSIHFPYEFGWLFVIPTEEGNGYSYPLLDAAIKASGGAGLFATVRTENGAMHHILPRRKFIAGDKPYASSRGPYQLRVFTRPSQTSNDLLAELIRQWESGKLPERKAAKPLPGPEFFKKLPDQLVIFIDLLGFGDQVLAADKACLLHEIHAALHHAQKLMDISSAADDMAAMDTLNRSYGKTVLALSDSIVIAVDPVSDAAHHRNPFDILCLELLYVLHAQMQLLAKGVFLRGGISHGKFHLKDGLLISPALVRAHRLEKAVRQPVIAIGKSTLDWIRSLHGAKFQQPDPMGNYIRSVPDLTPADCEALYILDYLPEYAREFESHWEPEDHARFVAAADGHERGAILDMKRRKARQMVVKVHKEKIEAAFNATADPVRQKYAWLLTYHNQVVQEFGVEMAAYTSTLNPG